LGKYSLQYTYACSKLITFKSEVFFVRENLTFLSNSQIYKKQLEDLHGPYIYILTNEHVYQLSFVKS